MMNKTISEYCRKESMKSGSTVSASSWSLENRLMIRPDGVMSKKLMGMEMICGGCQRPCELGRITWD